MAKDIDLSIVIVSYNTKIMTEECLESICHGPRNISIQVVVVDNASSDGSVQMVQERFPEVTLIANRTNEGFAVANNYGFNVCRGRYVLLLNSDTIVYEDVLTRSVGYMDANADVGALGCQVLNSDGSVQRTCSGFPSLTRLLIMTLALDRWPGGEWWDTYQMRHWRRDSERDVEVISGCYLLVRREVIEAVGVLDERFFFFGEETDWCRRIAEAGWRLRFALVGNILHYGGGSVKKLNFRRDVMLTDATVRLHEKHGGKIAAWSVFAILTIFNASRALYWSFRSLVSRSAKRRARHFRRVFFHVFSNKAKG